MELCFDLQVSLCLVNETVKQRGDPELTLFLLEVLTKLVDAFALPPRLQCLPRFFERGVGSSIKKSYKLTGRHR